MFPVLLRRMEDIALALHRANGTAGGNFLLRLNNCITSGEIAQKLADAGQVSTQSIGGKGGRMLAVSK